MEVVAREDKITHAVIGGGDQIHFGITDDAMFMHMLSSTLYSDKILAVARETLCNAWDAHIEAGVTDRAVEITLDRNKLVIKDYGFGIPRSKIGEVYGTYGNSTKKHDGKQTGGFGLGCKSPFAYTDHFEVTSCNDGTKTLYKMTKSSAELEGKPGIIPLLSVPTQETGITVSIDILSLNDYQRFNTLLQRLIANGEIFATINGETIDVIPFSKAKHGYAITKHKVLENRSELCVRYGNVIYPLERHEGYASQYDAASAILRLLAGNLQHHTDHQYSLVMQAPANTVSITPSREALSMETKTINTVTEVLNKFLASHRCNFDTECLQLVKRKVDSLVSEKQFGPLLRKPVMLNVMADTSRFYNKRVMITDTAEAAGVVLSQSYPTDGKFETKDMQYRLTQMIKANSDLLDPGLLQKFRREYTRTSTRIGKVYANNPRKWFVKNIVAPLASRIKEHPELDTGRLMLIGNHEMLKGWGSTIEVYPLDGLRGTELLGYLPFLREIVVLTHSKNTILDSIGRYTTFDEQGDIVGFSTKYGSRAGVMAYVVPRTPKKLAAARAFFQEHARVLVDLTQEVEYRDPVERMPVVDRREKPRGYVTVKACWTGEVFIQDNLTITANEHRVEKPLFVTTLNSKSDRSNSRTDLPGFNKKCSALILKMYGERGAAVLSTPQVDRLNKAGVPVLEDFLLGEIGKLLKDKKVKTFVGMTPSRVKAEVDLSRNVDDAIDMVWSNEVLFESFKLCAEITQDQRDLLEIWDYLKRSRTWNAAVDNLKGEERSTPLNKKALALGKKIEASKIIPYLDLEAVQEGIVSTDPSIKQDAINLFIKACKG